MIQIDLDKHDLSEAKRMLYGMENGFPKALARALNKTVTGTRTEMIALIRSRYNYKAETLRKRITTSRATWARLAASVRSAGYGIHLSDVPKTNVTKKGVSVDVKKSTGRHVILHAFKAPGQVSGKEIVFRRVDLGGGKLARRYPIEALYGPDPEILYNTKENFPVLKAAVQKRLDDNFQHEVDVVLKGVA